MTIRSQLLSSASMSAAERTMGRFMRAPDSHTPAPSPAPAPAPSPSPSPAPAPAPSPSPSPAPTPAPSPAPSPTPASTDRWQDKFLRENLRGEAELANFASVDDLADGYINTRNFARNRVALPKDGDEASFTEFASRLRPEKAEDYVLNVPEGQDAGLAEAMRPVFHQLGLHPTQATRLTDAWNQVQSDLASKAEQAAKDEVTAIELEYGPSAFEQRRQAANAMMASIIGEAVGEDGEIDDFMGPLEQAFGAGKAVKIAFALAERTGELAKVDPTIVNLQLGKLSPEQAQARLDQLQANAEWRDKVMVAGSNEARERQTLLDAIKKGVR